MDGALQGELRQVLADPEWRGSALLSAGYQGSAYLYQSDTNKLVVKEASGGLLTGWFHRMMLRREARVYQQLTGIAGVPASPGLLDNQFLVLEFVAGEPLKEQYSKLVEPEQYFSQLLQVLHDIHDVGIAHGDLKRAGNILVSPAEQPVVIDFGTAVNRNGALFDRLMFRLVRRFDYNAWVKLKYDRDYSAISAEDQQWYRPTIVETVFRQIRRFWRTITFRQARKRRQYQRQNKS